MTSVEIFYFFKWNNESAGSTLKLKQISHWMAHCNVESIGQVCSIGRKQIALFASTLTQISSNQN